MNEVEIKLYNSLTKYTGPQIAQALTTLDESQMRAVSNVLAFHLSSLEYSRNKVSDTAGLDRMVRSLER